MNKKISLIFFIILSFFSFSNIEANDKVIKTHTVNGRTYQSAVLKNTAKRVAQKRKYVILETKKGSRIYKRAVILKPAKRSRTSLVRKAEKKVKSLQENKREVLIKRRNLLMGKINKLILEIKKRKEAKKIQKRQLKSFMFGNKKFFF